MPCRASQYDHFRGYCPSQTAEAAADLQQLETVATQLTHNSPTNSAAGASLVLGPSPADLIECHNAASAASRTAVLAARTGSCLAVGAAAQAQHRACQILHGAALPVLLAAQRQYASKARPPAGSGSSHLSPPMLTRRLQDCKSPEQLLQEVQRHAANFNHINGLTSAQLIPRPSSCAATGSS
jgi:hypothetical protein